MASLSRFVRSVRPQDFKAHLEINRIIAPEEIDWSAPAEEVAEQFLQSLDQLSDDQRDRLIADAERISAMTDEPGQAVSLQATVQEIPNIYQMHISITQVKAES